MSNTRGMQPFRAASVFAALSLAALPATARADDPEPRLGWPADGRITGVYAHIEMLNQPWFPSFLDRLVSNGMNAVVIDAKDYSGWITYPSAIPLAAETHSGSHAVLKSLTALVHDAHTRGLRVLLRVACFHDPWLADHRRDLAIPGMTGWLDPKNTTVQDYLIAIVDETLADGVDEIQLDYVRYPTEGIGHADFGLDPKIDTTDVIAAFVKRVHDHTHAASVPLSLDIFGVVAWQRAVDVKATGQDLTKLAPVVEAVSPMVYPSHFATGFGGYTEPGAHPEVVAYGTKEAVNVLKKIHATAIIRPWIQAFPWHAPGYSTAYVQTEIAQAKAAGGTGWLGWNAGGYYNEVMAASSQTRAIEEKTAAAAK